MMEILESGNLRLRIGQRTVTVAVVRTDEEQGESLVIDLDSIEDWDDGEPVSMPELQRILAVLERECDARGLNVEFE
jgi:hypothetical protein